MCLMFRSVLCSGGSGCVATDSSQGYVRTAYPYAATSCTGTEGIFNTISEQQRVQGDPSSSR